MGIFNPDKRDIDGDGVVTKDNIEIYINAQIWCDYLRDLLEIDESREFVLVKSLYIALCGTAKRWWNTQVYSVNKRRIYNNGLAAFTAVFIDRFGLDYHLASEKFH